jgi:hypothetical protein
VINLLLWSICFMPQLTQAIAWWRERITAGRVVAYIFYNMVAPILVFLLWHLWAGNENVYGVPINTIPALSMISLLAFIVISSVVTRLVVVFLVRSEVELDLLRMKDGILFID